ncbi:E3 ubiquitin/ISG15 ligase TRIM25-like isoform X4 [Anguilla anguilla]|uniref:E3 ubiquitin/ISG15 ligase TRIM25-like isoform X4 n=1 Tax=Anguilla anguilla TaxID=7936 RepID=UPI0015AC8084|nr:E3 ubiquitin/ISG15 ligase TRIM25-like isoform X4 [Anguilla anguilla]
MADDMSSLLSLEEELTCSICLSPFESPVTTPCGHNFCRGCLDLIWRDSEQTGLGFNCPQCRSHFVTKPELRKNTVLDAVVDKFKLKSKADIFSNVMMTTKTEPEVAPIKCDACMGGKACKTCLTCMASYCVEHVRPHLENPVFATHQLREPLADLQERICLDHSKIMEFFCIQHRRCICSFCLQQEHKDCMSCTPDKQRILQESDLKMKLSQLDVMTEMTQSALSQMKEQQLVLKASTTNRKRELEMVYRQIREMLDRDEQQAVNSVEKEEEAPQSRLFSMMKKFNQNVEEMSGARDRITRLLAQTQSLAFLQASVDLPSAVDVEQHIPRLNINTKRAHLESATALKEYLENILKQPGNNRVALLKPGLINPVNPGPPPATKMEPKKEETLSTRKPDQDSSKEDTDNMARPPLLPKPLFPGLINPVNPGPPVATKMEPKKKETLSTRKPDQDSSKEDTDNMASPPLLPKPLFPGLINPVNPGPPPATKTEPKKKRQTKKPDQDSSKEDKTSKKHPNPAVEAAVKEAKERMKLFHMAGAQLGTQPASLQETPPSIMSPAKRTDLLKYGTVLTLDHRTAHKRIVLSENFTKASVSDEPAAYPDSPARFSVCSQVLCTKGFSQGRHYWEVKMTSNNFCGVGLAYNSIDRKGPTSRLGRNAQSWCVEWFNVKLSAWHDSSETVLANPSPSRVGVLLDCAEGTATFYNVADRAYPFHTFVYPFCEAVYPAFWIFSSGTAITLCKLTN